MTAAPPIDLMDIFTPTTIVKRDPFNGFTQERYEERENEKRERRQRMRAMMQRAKDPKTDNRALWVCIHCFKSFSNNDPMYLTFNPQAFTYAAKCQACYLDLGGEDVAPLKRSGVVVARGGQEQDRAAD